MTSKTRIALGLGAVAILAGTGVVWATDQNINLNASVPKFCNFNAVPTISALNNVSVGSNSVGSTVINITNPTNSTGIMNNAGFNFSVNATCNFSSKVTLTSFNGGLKDLSPEPIISGTFVNRIDYTALATWADAPLVIFSTTGAPMSSSTPSLASGPTTGTLAVGVGVNLNTTNPVLAGTYTDTLRISLEPQ